MVLIMGAPKGTRNCGKPPYYLGTLPDLLCVMVELRLEAFFREPSATNHACCLGFRALDLGFRFKKVSGLWSLRRGLRSCRVFRNRGLGHARLVLRLNFLRKYDMSWLGTARRSPLKQCARRIALGFIGGSYPTVAQNLKVPVSHPNFLNLFSYKQPSARSGAATSNLKSRIEARTHSFKLSAIISHASTQDTKQESSFNEMGAAANVVCLSPDAWNKVGPWTWFRVWDVWHRAW